VGYDGAGSIAERRIEQLSKLYEQSKDEETEKPEDSLSRLIAEQRVAPINNLDELADLWPVDDNPDSLMSYILAERQARLQIKSDDQSR
jgi:hypothetical protein